MEQIRMVDLKNQYLKIKKEIDEAIESVIQGTDFIKGSAVKVFEKNLAQYLGVKYVISCANGTDALQIALMSLDLKPHDEIICPSFSFISGAEMAGLLNLRPVFVDVDYDNFNTTVENITQAISVKTRVIMPVHLFGQGADMEKIMAIAKQYNLTVIEDNAQSLGAEYRFSDDTVKKLGTIGNIGCTSFFPSKNLGCFGDGGALFTNDEKLAEKMHLIANHGMKEKYNNERIGINSRLDTLQAAVLNVKLRYLDSYISARRKVAEIYYENLKDLKEYIILPKRESYSDHTFHQFTLKVLNGKRDELKLYLADKGIPSSVYYPKPLHLQQAFIHIERQGNNMEVSEQLSKEVLSLPMHTELDLEQQMYIIETIKEFFTKTK
ncbi:MAG: DegT/DnrJ/EryC1/StrS family aminotransferase [Bacteroidales bacterium]|nr:DegT/DnrJ/EryC1/StrS family aminotransferase [Bacteroidales bacterium]